MHIVWDEAGASIGGGVGDFSVNCVGLVVAKALTEYQDKLQLSVNVIKILEETMGGSGLSSKPQSPEATKDKMETPM